tara:strand:+ start:1233 stop:3191 length:1959 start_codon:yes stop_codon:yes gene_type:complete
MEKKITTTPSGISLDGQKLKVKNKSKFRANNKISFDEKGNVSIELDTINVSPEDINTTSSNIPIEGNIPTIKPTAMGVGNYALDTVLNVIPSTKQLLHDYAQPFIHPINTFNAVKDMIVGFQELRDRSKFIKENPNKTPEPMTENMIMAEAVNSHFAERYGDWVGNETDDWNVIGKKFADTFRKDPAGVLADVSGILSLGVIPAAKFGGKTGRIAQSIAQNLDPVQGLLTGGGKISTNVIAPLIGKDKGLLKNAFDSGASKSSSNAFNVARKGKLQPTEIMQDYINKVNNLKSKASAQYNSWIEALPSSYIENLKTPALILKEIEEIKYGKKGKQKRPFLDQTKENIDIDVEGGLINPATNKPFTKPAVKIRNTKRASEADLSELNKLEKEVLEYANNPNLQNAQGLAQLKIKLGQIKFNNPSLQKIQTKINKSIKEDLTLVDRNTPVVMKNYETMINNLEDLKMSIGDPTKGNFNPQTAINKALAILKENPKGQLGFDKSNPILGEIKSDIIPSLTGNSLSDLAGPNTGKFVFGSLLGSSGDSLFSQMPQFGGTGEFLRNASLTGVPLSSPNVMGNVYNTFGVLNRYGVNPRNAGNVSRGILNPLTSSTEAPFGNGLDDLDIQNLMRTSKTSETTPMGAGINNLFEYFNYD